MSFDLLPSNEFLKHSGDRKFGSKLKKTSSRQQTDSTIARERVVLPQSNRSPIYSDKLQAKDCAGPSYKDFHNDADEKIFDKTKSRHKKSIKPSATKSDELVKYMTNLPGYLQHAERGENLQEKVLNFGVLDWAQLEKWKHKQKRVPEKDTNNTSCKNSKSSLRTTIESSTSSGDKETLAQRQVLLSSSIKSSSKNGLPQGAKRSSQNVRRFQESETEIRRSTDGQKVTPGTFKSFGKNHSDISLKKGKRKDLDKTITSQVRNFESNLRNYGHSHSPKENVSACDAEAKKSLEDLQVFSIKKKDRNHKFISNVKLPSSKFDDNELSLGSGEKKIASNCETKKRVPKFQGSDVDVGCKQRPRKDNNIVLLLPTEIPQSSFPDVLQLSQFSTSLNEQFDDARQSSFSDRFLPEEVHSSEACSGIPNPCALPSKFESSAPSDWIQDSLITDLDVDLSSDMFQTSSCSSKTSSLLSEGTYKEKDMLETKPKNHYVASTLKDPLSEDTAELSAGKSRNPSPNCRFSFGLGRIGRSFSFKEGSSVPLFSSTYATVKSGPVTSESSACLDNPNKEKANAPTRSRSSPFRRLLDPILKYKAADAPHSTQTFQPPKGSVNSINSGTIGVTESLHIENNEGGTIQAFLQLTVKNGVPLFKFVLNNEGKILAATMKNLASPMKDESEFNLTFYLVNEIKKKSGGWISHGSKEKSCGYVYNVVGEMMVSNSHCTELEGDNCERQFMVKEYVLSGVDIRQTDQESPNFIQRREVAAVVVKIPCENLSCNELQNDKYLMEKECGKCLTENNWSCSSGENGVSNGTTVILPGGVHASPSKGEPSTLIYRWKSGGCDCGGWDIGCKLCVLSSQAQCCSIPKGPRSCAVSKHFELFQQGRAEKDGPIFSMTLLKDEIFSVEFKSSISLLQAFFISVAVISDQKPSNLSEVSNMYEEVSKDSRMKENDGIQGKAPARYTPNPPLSPVGRV
ncbi:DUF3527 domain protein [Quillaja saponaria]|uniref:DUF3527 domain protein n=1 Tax=Quillaja saponaria TaxID=32244 RepID=A0AAD7LQU9_QUISA|nr:DUF3527 domain protein [Quillaja saponaria]